jgi:hypothetical protein
MKKRIAPNLHINRGDTFFSLHSTGCLIFFWDSNFSTISCEFHWFMHSLWSVYLRLYFLKNFQSFLFPGFFRPLPHSSLDSQGLSRYTIKIKFRVKHKYLKLYESNIKKKLSAKNYATLKTGPYIIKWTVKPRRCLAY